MQRRAAAAYFVFFLVVGAAAFSVMTLAEEPEIDLGGETYGINDTFQVGDREYRVSELGAEDSGGGGGHGGGGGDEPNLEGSLVWTNESALYTDSLANNSTVEAVSIQWPGQTGRHEATLREGDTVAFEGEQRRVNITNGGFALERGNNSSSFSVGDTLLYRHNTSTVAAVSSQRVDLVWGTYRVRIPNDTNVTDPDSFTIREEPNVSAILMSDERVYNRTVVVDGTQSVVYRNNNSTRPLEGYLPEPDQATFSEGDQFTYQHETVSIGNITLSEVPIEWFAPRENEIDLAEGANITLNDQPYVVHFEDEHTVELSPDRAGYQRAIARQAYFHERMNGLKGIIILSGLVGVLFITMAYMPVRG